MHDEFFVTTAGTIRFHLPDPDDPTKETTIDAPYGGAVTVPIRAPHTFSNPFDEEAKFLNTYTPSYYINYFKMLGQLLANSEKMTPEANKAAMANFATIPIPKPKKWLQWSIWQVDKFECLIPVSLLEAP